VTGNRVVAPIGIISKKKILIFLAGLTLSILQILVREKEWLDIPLI